MSDPDFDAWIDRARHADILATAQSFGAQLRRTGAEWAGACPKCGGHDRFAVNIKDRVWLCRGSGDAGDVIAMTQHVKECDFVEACAIILNEDPPRGERRPPDPAVEKERREERRDDRILAEREEAADLRAAISDATAMFERARPIAGTMAEDYLNGRGLFLHRFCADDLRFIPNLEYWGYLDREADEVVLLGAYHCMVAAIRDIEGRVIGVHRTYLDAGRSDGDHKPSGQAIKLRPPGDKTRNKAKKVFRRWAGGLIRLGGISNTLATGEGVESSASWKIMADDGEFGEEFTGVSIASGVALGNLSGGATGTRPHPNPPRGRVSATIMNGEPDPEKPGMILPPQVKRLILIGDGDSDPAETRAKLLTGAERYRRHGVETMVWMAPNGADANDVLLSRKRAAA